MPVMQALRKLKKEDCKFETSMHFVVPCWHELQCETLPGEGGMVQLRQGWRELIEWQKK